MILLRKGFIIREKCHKLLNCSHVAGASHCIKGTKANDEVGEIIPIRESEDRLASVHFIRMVCQDEGCKVSGRGIYTEYLHKLGYLAQVAESIARGLIVAAKEINIEDVFPGTSTHGARFDLAQADVAQGENAQGFEK